MINFDRSQVNPYQLNLPSNRGIVIPIIIGVLTLFFILLMALSQSNTELGRSVSLTNHRQHARFMALSAIEEMHNIMWNRVSNPINVTAARNDMIESVVGGGEYEIDLRADLKYSNILYMRQTNTGAKNQKKATTSIFEAKARFHNFRPIVYSSTGIYSNPNPYYRSPDGAVGGLPAGGPQGTHQDYYGWVTYTVKAQHGIVSKEMTQSRPIKIVDMTPMAREYALFEMESAQGASLNEGPGFYIEANDVGRIRMDGPYYIDVEGGSDGKAISWGNRKKATGGLSYPEFSKNRWSDDSYVPGPKWVTYCPGWASVGGSGGKRLRLHNGASISVMYMVCLCCPALVLIPIDVIAQQMQPTTQQYIAAKVKEGQQTFSLTGRDGNVKFKGLLYASDAGYEAPQGIAENWNPDKDFEVRHEGVIVGTYKTYKSKLMRTCGPPITTPWGVIHTCIFAWSTSEGPEFQQIYAYKGDEDPEIDWMGTLIGAAMDIGTGMTMGGGLTWAKGGGLTGFNLATFTPIMKGIGQQLMFQTAGAMLGGNLDPGRVPTPQQITNVFPSGFRLMHRAAVRHFANMDEALWKKDKLLLDGVTWIDNLNSKVREIKYIGKGTITAFTTGFTPEQKLPKILPDDDGKDFLNLWFHGGPNGDFLTTDAEQLQLSLYASNGINPKRDLDIIGNYITSTIRKSELDKDTDIIYWREKLHDPSKAEFLKEYRVVSMSPKIEAINDIMLKVNRGVGADGVDVIVDDLGE